jgi:hypothetical protein
MHAPSVLTQADVRPRTTGDTLARAILAGFAASLAMLLLFLVAYNVARVLSAAPTPAWPVLERRSIIHPASWVTTDGRSDLASGQATSQTDLFETPRLWLTNLTHNRLIDTSLSDVYLASGVYFTGGLLWAIVYALVQHRLPGAPWKRGALFGLLPAVVSLVAVLPLLGGGFFGLALGAGPLPAIGNVLLHLAYGAMLGVIIGPFGDLDASTLERPTWSEEQDRPRSYEPTAALLLVAGLFAGALLGLVASMATPEPDGLTILSASSSGLILWGALLGAVVGLFIGSFAGLGRTVAQRRDT